MWPLAQGGNARTFHWNVISFPVAIRSQWEIPKHPAHTLAGSNLSLNGLFHPIHLRTTCDGFIALFLEHLQSTFFVFLMNPRLQVFTWLLFKNSKILLNADREVLQICVNISCLGQLETFTLKHPQWVMEESAWHWKFHAPRAPRVFRFTT